MATISEITDLVNEYLELGGLCKALELKEILLDILGNMGGGSPIVPVDLISTVDAPISTLKTGSVINGHTCETGDVVVLLGQTVPEENGIYIIALNEGGTDRHPDFPDAASCGNKIVISENADESGNFVTTLKLNDVGAVISRNLAASSGSASGSDTTSGVSKAITFENELPAAPTKIKLWIWDDKGMPVSGGYDPASLATTGFTVLIPGNNEAVTIIYEATI